MTQASRWEKTFDIDVSLAEKGRLEWMTEGREKLCSAARVYDGSGSWLEARFQLCFALALEG